MLIFSFKRDINYTHKHLLKTYFWNNAYLKFKLLFTVLLIYEYNSVINQITIYLYCTFYLFNILYII